MEFSEFYFGSYLVMMVVLVVVVVIKWRRMEK